VEFFEGKFRRAKLKTINTTSKTGRVCANLMNNPNPFVPKGSLLEQQSLRRSRLKIAVGCVLAVSICALVAMLIEGCKREAPDTEPPIDTNPPALEMSNTPPVAMDTNPPPPMPPPMAPSNTMVLPPPQPPIQQPPMEPAAASTYVVVSGDTLGRIAKTHGVTLKALEEANPGVDPKKLMPKQKLNIPAPTQSSDTTSAAPMAATSAGGETYLVKSCDTLSKIAREQGVKLKALREANPSVASTDHIKVGDKLTIPPKAETPAPVPVTDTTTAPVPPPSAPAPAPITPAPAPGH
jgi:LysM repeat protein